MKRGIRMHFERVRLEVALQVAEREIHNSPAASEGKRRGDGLHLGGTMISQFDVFVSEPGGNVMWQGAAATMKDAEAMIKKLAEASPQREYVIFNLKTGQRIAVKADGLDGASSQEDPNS